MITSTFGEWLSAFQERNIQKMVSLLTDDIRIESLVFGTHIGKEGATNYWEQLYKTFPKINVTPVTITSEANRLAAELDITGTERERVDISMARSYSTPIRGAFVYEFSNNKIKEIRMYYDSTSLKRKLERSDVTD